MAREGSRDTSQGPGGSFGARLRRLREMAGLTQEELASRAGLTPNAVSALERGQRKRPYPHTVRSLADALGLSGDERAALIAAVSERDAHASTPPSEPATHSFALPASLTPLLGREREVDEIAVLLGRAAVRLLTLTGPGGIGKTRLAVEAARKTQDIFPGGVAFVALASLRDAALVVSTVSRTLGLKEAAGMHPLEVLRQYLRERKFLLVLDNFEHVAQAALEVVGLLSSCPDLRVLVTSRAPLRVRGEREYPVYPLVVPDPSHAPEAEEVAQAPAARLFVERARNASATFELTRGNAGAVAAICWRLDGMPLALELVAARTRFLGPAALLSRLDQALEAGGARDLPERQRTMRATLDWSYELLHEPERALFRRLSVFAGGFTLEAAEEVCAGGTSAVVEGVLVLLGNLVEQSLVVAETGSGGRTRYRILEPVRQYALERLRESGEEDEARLRHALYFLDIAEEADPEIKGPRQLAWLERLETEHDNLGAAMGRLLENDVALAVRLAYALWLFWWIRGRFTEGRRWAEEALARGGATMPASSRAKALFVAGTMAGGQADSRTAQALLEESLSLFRELGDKGGAARALGSSGIVALGQKRYEKGVAAFQEGADLFLEVGEKWGAAIMFCFLAVARLEGGDSAGARRLAEKGLALSREVGDRHGSSDTLYVLARLAHASDDPERAARLFEEGLRHAAGIWDETKVAYCLEGLAATAAEDDLLKRAARLWGASEALFEKIETTAYPYAPDRSLYHRQVAAARERLDEQQWAQAWAEGGAMSFEEAVAYALEEGAAPDPPKGSGS